MIARPQQNNKVLPPDRAIHDWYRFVLSFPPHLVREYLARFEITPAKRVLDPFCGTGTTLIECQKLGVPSVGVEANPMAAFASQVKTEWRVDPEMLQHHAVQVADAAHKELGREGRGVMEDLPLFRMGTCTTTALRTLPPESAKLLLKDSISPLPLHKTLVLLEAMRQNHDDRFANHERLAFAKAVVLHISNLEFGPEVGVGAAKKDAPVVAAWLAGVASMADDLIRQNRFGDARAEIIQGDSRRLSSLLAPGSIDAVITSPPYPNEKDYTRTTRLESVLLGFITDKPALRRLKQGLLRSNTRGVYKADIDDLEVSQHPEIQRIANSIEQRRIELGKTSGFERLYARVAKLYFGGMARHLADLRAVLRPGAHMAYVVGDQASYLQIMIRTGELLADIAKSLGYEVVAIDLFRTRRATATREHLREEVLVLQWPGDSQSRHEARSPLRGAEGRRWIKFAGMPSTGRSPQHNRRPVQRMPLS